MCYRYGKLEGENVVRNRGTVKVPSAHHVTLTQGTKLVFQKTWDGRESLAITQAATSPLVDYYV